MTSPTIYSKKTCVAQLYFPEQKTKQKQKPMQGIRINPSQSEKGITMLKRAQLHSVFTNTETLLTPKSGKPPS